MVDPVAVFVLIIFATTQAKSFQYDCNNSKLYKLEAAASGMDDLWQLQYCLIDNCTIMRIDTGQQLDIAYTTQSHLVVTPTDNQTSLLILKNEPKQFCFLHTGSITTTKLLVSIILLALTAILSGCSALVFLFFKELRTTFGKLMILNCFGNTFENIASTTLVVTTYMITVNSTMPCYIFWFVFLQGMIIKETSTTCLIAFFAYVMHSSYKSIKVNKETKKIFFKYSMVYVVGLQLVLNFLMISYDVGTDTYQHVILINDHCSFIPEQPYVTAFIVYTSSTFNVALQILLYLVYFIHYYKIQNRLKLIRNMANSNRQKDKKYFKLAVAMVATMGISKFIYVLNNFIEHSELLLIIGIFFSLVQQTLITILIMRSKKTAQLCKERFCINNSKISSYP